MSTRVALITGAARRIGAALARRFHTGGYNVILHCHQSIDAANHLATEMNQHRQHSAHVIQTDLSSITESSTFIAECHGVFSRLDVLINNASVFFPTPLTTLSANQFDDIIATNLRAPLFLSKAFKRWAVSGSIINIADIYGQRHLADYTAYSVSKAGLIMLTRSLAVEFAPAVRVNAVAPGAILWPEDDAEMTAADQQAMLADIPMGKLGTPQDIAQTALFLADADYITGQVVAVDGGSIL